MAKLTSYDYTRIWFDFAFENPDVITASHGIMYLWFLELNNRMGWAEKFGSPASQTMKAMGIKSYNTYIRVFKDLCDWGFIKLIKPSINQHQSCIIALSKFNKPTTKALDKALMRHSIKQLQSTVQSTVQSKRSIIKPQTILSNTIKIKERVWDESKNNFGNETKSLWIDLCGTTKWAIKSERALKMCLGQLMRYEEAFAIELMEYAIAGNYQGLTYPDTKEKYAKWKVLPKATTAQYVKTEKDTD